MAYAVITGNAGKDPELKTTAQGKSFCRFSIGWSERIKTPAGWEYGPTVWVSVIAFGRLAENIAATVYKGTRIVASGKLVPETWSTNHGEQTHLVLTADYVGPALDYQTADVHRNVSQQGYTPPSTEPNVGGFGAPVQLNANTWGAPANTGPGFDEPPF